MIYQKAVTALEKTGGTLPAWINRISMKKMAVCAAALFALSIVPLLALGKYNVMCIDDYDYGRQVHDTWMATGSLWQSVQTAARQNMEFYRNWQGTYVSCFLMALCPMNFLYDSAFIVPIIMIGMFSASTFLLGRQILIRWLGSDKWQASFIMFMILFLFYQVIEAPFEGIYWYNGATHYVFMESLLFFLLTLVSGSIWTEKKKNAIVWCVSASVCAVIVGGGNLITCLQAEILLVFLLVFTYLTERKKAVCVLLPFLTFTAGFLCNILAPGNLLRAGYDTDEGYFPVTAVLLSFYYAFVFMIRWSNTFVLLIWLASLPILWQIGKKSGKSFAHPVWVSVGAYCVLSAMFTPTLFAVGMVGLSRVDNIIQMVYYLCLFFVTAYWFGWSSHRAGSRKPGEKKDGGGRNIYAGEQLGIFLESTKNMMSVSLLLLALLVWTLTANKNTYTSISALRSIINGEAKTYYAEAMERHDLYTDETVTDVVVEPFSVRPALFDFDDLTQDGDNWLNLAVAQYYHKNSVKMKSAQQ